MLQGIATIGSQPGGQPAQVAGIVTACYGTLEGMDRPRILTRITTQPTAVGKGHLILPAQQEGRLHVLQVHPALLTDEDPAMIVSQSNLGKVTSIGEDAQREAAAWRIRPLDPTQSQPLGHALQAGKKPTFDGDAQNAAVGGQKFAHLLIVRMMPCPVNQVDHVGHRRIQGTIPPTLYGRPRGAR